jgi:hypothetical protein
MSAHAPFTTGRQRLRTIGRIGFALLAGGAFAALAWEPSPAPRPPDRDAAGTSNEATAARQGIVKEDGPSPHLDSDRAKPYHESQWGLRSEDQWAGLAGERTRTQPWTAEDRGADATAGQHVGGQVPTNETTEAKTAANTGVNSRGPP